MILLRLLSYSSAFLRARRSWLELTLRLVLGINVCAESVIVFFASERIVTGEYFDHVEDAAWAGGAAEVAYGLTRPATVMVPLYGEVDDVDVLAGGTRGVNLSILRNAWFRRREVEHKDVKAAAVKESWTAAGAKLMNTGVRAGRAYISRFRILLVCWSTPASPPICREILLVLEDTKYSEPVTYTHR